MVNQQVLLIDKLDKLSTYCRDVKWPFNKKKGEEKKGKQKKMKEKNLVI